MTKNVLVPMANGAEDTELIAIIDVLRRVKDIGADINVICASLDDDKHVKLDSGTVVLADTNIKEADLSNLDAIVLPGGFGGMTNLKNNEKIISLIKELNNSNKLIAAFCASPIVLWEAGVLSNEFTCYPGCESGIRGTRLDEAVVVRNNIITGAGPAVVIPFALRVAKELGFEEQANDVAEGLLITNFGISF